MICLNGYNLLMRIIYLNELLWNLKYFPDFFFQFSRLFYYKLGMTMKFVAWGLKREALDNIFEKARKKCQNAGFPVSLLPF